MKERILIAGPTASGKSSLAVLLAEEMNAEIISVDSRQCYRQINTGTAKPTREQLARVPHHNVSVLDLEQPDTVAEFKKRAVGYAEAIEKKGKRVIYCGGSSLHLQSIFHPLDDIPGANQANIRALNEKIEEEGLESLYRMLRKADPEYVKKMDGMNRQRMLRALDVWMQTGRPFSDFHSDKSPVLPENYHLFALHHPRKVLHRRIEKRADQMIGHGLVEETEALLEEGYSPDLQALQTVGYKQVIQYLRNELSRDQMIADIKTATRRYAKRQITWLRRWPFVQWLDLSEDSQNKTEADLVEYIQQQVAANNQKG